MPLDTIFFDLDGTLTEPRVGITRSFQHALERLGRPVPPADGLLWCIGPPIREVFGRLLETEDAAAIERAVGLYRERYGTVGLFEANVLPGIQDALAAIRRLGVSIYVVTSKPQVYADPVIDHFALRSVIERVFGCRLDGQDSDKTSLIRDALAATGRTADRTWMVGDREHDVRGAAANGVRAVGVTWGYGSERELREAGASALARTPAELVSLVADALVPVSEADAGPREERE